MFSPPPISPPIPFLVVWHPQFHFFLYLLAEEISVQGSSQQSKLREDNSLSSWCFILQFPVPSIGIEVQNIWKVTDLMHPVCLLGTLIYSGGSFSIFHQEHAGNSELFTGNLSTFVSGHAAGNHGPSYLEDTRWQKHSTGWWQGDPNNQVSHNDNLLLIQPDLINW